jgi:hypothetical protein
MPSGRSIPAASSRRNIIERNVSTASSFSRVGTSSSALAACATRSAAW